MGGVKLPCYLFHLCSRGQHLSPEISAFRPIDIKTDREGRYVIINANIYDNDVVLVGLYLPPSGSVQILHEILQVVVQLDTNLVFLLGNFNMIPCNDLHRMCASTRDSPLLRHWADTFTLTDVWGHMHPTQRKYTGHSSTFKKLSRIDLDFASGPALQCVQDVSVLPRGISDYAPPCLSLALTVPPESRLWRLSRY